MASSKQPPIAPVEHANEREHRRLIAYRANAALMQSEHSQRFPDTIADLRTTQKLFDSVEVLGYYAAGDGGGGLFYADTSDTSSADNGGSIIVADDGTRWKRAYIGQVDVRWFGTKGDGVADDAAAITAALTLSPATVVGQPGDTYRIESPVFVPSNTTLDLAGATVLWAGAGSDSLLNGAVRTLGVLTGTATTLTANVAKDTSVITVASASGLAVGDYILIDSAETVIKPDLYLLVLAKIVLIDGLDLTVDVTFPFDADYTKTINVTLVSPAQNVTIRNAKFTAAGQTARSNGVGGVLMTYSANCTVEDCSFAGFWFKGVKAFVSSSIKCRNLTITNPAATGGGEGYGVQFEYVYNSEMSGLRGDGLRHLTDLTCTINTHISDCYDVRGLLSSYIHHSAYEYYSYYKHCHSVANAQGGFVLGSVVFDFGDTSSKTWLSNCSATDCKSGQSALKFASLGEELYVEGCVFSNAAGVVGQALEVANNNCYFSNCSINGGVIVAFSADFKTDGETVVSGTHITSNAQRVFNIAAGQSLTLSNCTLTGRATMAENTSVNILDSTWTRDGSQPLLSLLTNTDTQQIALKGCTILGGSSTTAMALEGERIDIVNTDVDFSSAPTMQLSLQPVRLNIVGCDIKARIQLGGSATEQVSLKSSRFFNSSNRPLYMSSITSDVGISDCFFESGAAASQAVFMETDASSIDEMLFLGNRTYGSVTLINAQITRCIIKNNFFTTSATVTLPTASASKLVSDNLTSSHEA